MKLGTQTASVINNLYSREVIGEPAPVVGMGCTMLGWTDRRPGTIVEVVDLESKVYSTLIYVTEDEAFVYKGSMQDGSAEYSFRQRIGAAQSMFRKNRVTGFWENARYNEKDRMVKSNGNGIMIGKREKYYDPSF